MQISYERIKIRDHSVDFCRTSVVLLFLFFDKDNRIIRDKVVFRYLYRYLIDSVNYNVENATTKTIDRKLHLFDRNQTFKLAEVILKIERALTKWQTDGHALTILLIAEGRKLTTSDRKCYSYQ